MRDKLGRFLKGTHWRPVLQFWDRDWLIRNYITLKRSTGEIAADFSVTDAAILFWLRKHKIIRRTVSEARKVKHWGARGAANPMHGKTGSLSPRYIDGSSPERQRIYAQGAGRQFIASVLKRDDFRCRRCGSGSKKQKWLHVHHIRSWAGNPSLRMDTCNAVTLCKPCHNWVHSKKNNAKEFIK